LTGGRTKKKRLREMIETSTKTYQGTSYDFLRNPRQLEFLKKSIKIRNSKNIETILNDSKINEQVLVNDDDIILSRHINNYLFNIQNTTNKLIQTSQGIIVDEILNSYGHADIELRGLTIWDEGLGTISEGYIFSSEEMKHYEQTAGLNKEGQVLVATSINWGVVFIDGGDLKTGKTAIQKYTVKVINEEGYDSGIIPNFLPMMNERGLCQFGKNSSSSAFEFFQFNGKRAKRLIIGGRGKGKGVRKEKGKGIIREEEVIEGGEELDYEPSDDDDEEYSSITTPQPTSNPTFTPANTPVVPVKQIHHGSGIAIGSTLTAMEITPPVNVEIISKKRRIGSVEGFVQEQTKIYNQLREEYVQEQSVIQEELNTEKEQVNLLIAEKNALLHSVENTEKELEVAKEKLKKVKLELEKEKEKSNALKLKNVEMEEKLKKIQTIFQQ
jgi:hypothetical protein